MFNEALDLIGSSQPGITLYKINEDALYNIGIVLGISESGEYFSFQEIHSKEINFEKKIKKNWIYMVGW